MVKRRPFKKPLLLLDRDGTLIREEGYPTDPKKVCFLSGVSEALRKLKKAGFPVAIISNQSGVSRGFITFRQARSVNRRFLALLKIRKASVDGFYWCPHAPKDHCSCRKPALGLVRRAARDLGVSWKNSVSVGDRQSDVQMGQRTGGQGVLVLTGYGQKWKKNSGADYVARNFSQAAAWILKQKGEE